MDEQNEADKKIEELKKVILFKFLTKPARERLNMVRITHPEIASKIELAVMQSLQAGEIKRQIDENEIKLILDQITEKRESKIIRR